MSFKLYELAEMYENILNLIEDEETDSESLEAALGQVEDNIESKAENTAKLIKTIEGDVETIKAEEKRLQGKRRALENKKDGIKGYLEHHLKVMNIDKVKTPLFTVALQNSPASVKVLDEDLIPEKYKKTVTTTSVVKKDLLDALKNGEVIEGAEIKQSKHLRIR